MVVKRWCQRKLEGKRVFISSSFDFESCSYEVKATDIDSLWSESLDLDEIRQRGTQVCPFLVSEHNKSIRSAQSALREIQKALKGEISLVSRDNTGVDLEQTQADPFRTPDPPSSPVQTPPSDEPQDQPGDESGLDSDLLRLAVQQPIENLGTLNWIFELKKCSPDERTEVILELIDSEVLQTYYFQSGADGLEKEHYKDELQKKKLIENKFGIQMAKELKFFDNKKYWTSFKEKFLQEEHPETATILSSLEEYWDITTASTHDNESIQSTTETQSQASSSQYSSIEPVTPTKKRTYSDMTSQPSQSTISTSIVSPSRRAKRVRQELMSKKKKPPRRI
ncbi:hypothetical protein TRVA0_028S01244 [Trichomonascus vanleenenianus]|uniref:uncharacterized protein n=1 Tax=Trichomonascus vanleenenianus TaxID=2268995 RepID=UPI003EC9D42D